MVIGNDQTFIRLELSEPLMASLPAADYLALDITISDNRFSGHSDVVWFSTIQIQQFLSYPESSHLTLRSLHGIKNRNNFSLHMMPFASGQVLVTASLQKQIFVIDKYLPSSVQVVFELTVKELSQIKNEFNDFFIP